MDHGQPWASRDLLRARPSGEYNNALNSPELRQGDTWQVKIFAPGTYAYLNNVHAGMIGHVSVSG